MPFSIQVGIVFFRRCTIGVVVVLWRFLPRALLSQVFAMWQCDCQHVMSRNREMPRNNINHCRNSKEHKKERGIGQNFEGC